MNLRRRLQRQTLFSALIVFALLLALLFAWTVHDTRREIDATRSLVRQTVREVLIAQGGSTAQAAKAASEAAPLRHVTLTGDDAPRSAPAASGGWIDKLVDAQPEYLPVKLDAAGQPLGAQLVIRANARSEFFEHLLFAGIGFAGLLAFGGVVAWTQYHTLMRAFAPVQTFKARLEDFERGDLSARLPEPELDELAVIAQTFNRLAATLQQMIDEQRRLSQSLLLSRSEERQRLARELHDEMGQLLTSLSVNIAISKQRAADPHDTATNLATLERDVQALRQVTRDLLTALRDPSVPEMLPAQTASALVAAWRQRFPGVAFVVPDDLDESLQRLRHTDHQVARRVLQESLTNAFRHAKPSRVVVATDGAQPWHRLTIDNDGVDPQSAATPGYGMTGMAERAAAIGARFAAQRLAADAWRVSISFAPTSAAPR